MTYPNDPRTPTGDPILPGPHPRRGRQWTGYAIGGALLTAGLVLVGCGATHQDAPKPELPGLTLTRQQEIQEPNGYRNAMFGCLGPNGVYITSAKSDDTLASSIFVLANDPMCR
jgi:hypothetical protein